MLVIGERINGMFKKVGKAIREKDKGFIQELAQKQVEGGARMLDVNVGPAAADPISAIQWLVETIQEVCEVPLAIDSANPEVIEAGLKVCQKKALINSTTGEEKKLKTILELAVKYKAGVLGLAMDEKGIPSETSARTEIGLKILAACMEAGIPTEDLHLDPVVLPVKFAQPQCGVMLETIREFKLLSSPPPHIVIGLSNISQGTKIRSLINRTYLVMAIACGLDEAIFDPLDQELMNAMITAELLLNKNIYCDSYLDAYKKAL
jgi:5-methyltetrahydrofolate corrinoid/iron sulfur protein methyltransferase